MLHWHLYAQAHSSNVMKLYRYHSISFGHNEHSQCLNTCGLIWVNRAKQYIFVIQRNIFPSFLLSHILASQAHTNQRICRTILTLLMCFHTTYIIFESTIYAWNDLTFDMTQKSKLQEMKRFLFPKFGVKNVCSFLFIYFFNSYVTRIILEFGSIQFMPQNTWMNAKVSNTIENWKIVAAIGSVDYTNGHCVCGKF